MNIVSAYRHRVMRAFRRAGIDADRARGALVHGLRHTFATELANADVSVYALMKPLGHESIATAAQTDCACTASDGSGQINSGDGIFGSPVLGGQ